MKLALGLFHFNAHWNTDARSGHRHCSETLGPLLAAVRRNPAWTVSIEMSGAGLEWLSHAYPGYLRLLRLLIDRGQVELISSLYTPSIWVAFPKRDLLESLHRNRRVLDRLRLPWTRIFFAQEGFIGAGITSLQDHFDFAICKDDYLDHFYGADWPLPGFLSGGMKFVVASNHLVCEISETLKQAPERAGECGLTARHHDYLRQVQGLNDPRNFPGARGRAGSLEWLWYHCGDGNHFGAIHKPDDLQHCYFDAPWNRLCQSQLELYLQNGYRLGSIADLATRLDYEELPELPPLVEGGWNPAKSGGVALWMGRHSGEWENDAGVLSSVQRARLRILAAEQVGDAAGPLLDQAWDALLHAQISDALGWRPHPQAVEYAVAQAERAFVLANEAMAEGPVERWNWDPDEAECLQESTDSDGADLESALPKPELLGGKGTGGWAITGPRSAVYEVHFTSSGPHCGIRVPLSVTELVYCASGREDQPVRLPFAAMKARQVYLPLSNGLLQIAPNLFLIKDTRFMHVAAAVDLHERTVTFGVEGARNGSRYRWRFELVVGTFAEALERANRLNGASAGCEDPTAQRWAGVAAE